VSEFYIQNGDIPLFDDEVLPDSFSIKYNGDRYATTNWDANSLTREFGTSQLN